MRIYNIGICDRNPSYAVSVMDYINTEKDLNLKAVAFTGMKAVDDYLKKKELDLIVTDDVSGCIEMDGIKIFCDVRCVELLEDRGCDTDGIFKYQNINMLCKETIRRLVPAKSNPSKVFGCQCVFSPLGRCGKTRFAKALAAEDEVRGGLYIGMEEYSGLSADTGASEILYQLKQRMPNMEDIIENQLLSFGNIKMLQAAGAYFDMREIGKEDIQWLNETLFGTGRFSTIVYDIGGSSLMDYGILSCFDEIYMPVLPDEVSQNKIRRFESMIRDMGYRSILTKITRVNVPDADSFDSEMMKAVWKVKHEDR